MNKRVKWCLIYQALIKNCFSFPASTARFYYFTLSFEIVEMARSI